MSGSRNRPADWAEENSPHARDFAGRIRKMAIKLTSTSTWQVVGHLLLDGNTEVRDAEVFSNVGFYSRPKSSSRPDAIVLFVGGAQNPVIVACRDEDQRKAVVAALPGGKINEDETIAYSGTALIHIKSDGTVEIRTSVPGSIAVPLATLADLQALTNYVKKQFHGASGHTHATPSGPTTSVVEGTIAGGTAPNPVGTTVLKAQ